MGRINDAVCKHALNGWCDQLGKYRKNYAFVFLLTLAFTYAIPLLVLGIVLTFSSSIYIEANYLMYFSSVFPAVPVLFIVNASFGLVVGGIMIFVLNFFYIVYMVRQLGIFVLMPVAVEIARWVVVLFFKEWIIIAIVLSLIPFMTFAVASHFIAYTIGKGVITRR